MMVNNRPSSQLEFERSSFETLPSFTSDDEQVAPFSFDNRVPYDLTPPSEADDFYPESTSQPVPIVSKSEPLVAIIGVGYVGQHLIDVFSQEFNVIGYDISEARVTDLKQRYENDKRVRLTTSPLEISPATHFLISVPTLLQPDRSIDSSYLRQALKTVARVARAGSTVVVESSVAVGMTRQLLGPLAREKSFFAGMSPERVDPGRTEPPARAIPKIISGLDDVAPGSLAAVQALYSRAFDTVTPVSCPEVAEMTKLYENCQRMVCIAYANEMADACIAHGINPFEVCKAAATKPFGYMSFMPGVGVGGHCIPVNPYYLLSNNEFPMLQAASEKMALRPGEIAERVAARLCNRVYHHRPSVLVVGMGFKPGQAHLTNSPGLELAKRLVLTEKVQVNWVDPLVSQSSIPQIPRLDDADWCTTSLEARFELIVVAFRQRGLDFSLLEHLQNVEVEMWCP